MKKARKWIVGMAGGAAYASLILVASRGLIRGLGRIVGEGSRLAGMAAEEIAQIEQILNVLIGAIIASPWLPALLIGAVLGGLLGLLPGRWIKRILLTLLGVIAFVPLVLVAICFTAVNGISVGMFIRILIRLAGAMM